MDARQDFCSIVCGAKFKEFCSKILGAKQVFFPTLLDAKQDFRASDWLQSKIFVRPLCMWSKIFVLSLVVENIFLHHLCSNILGGKQDFCSIILDAKQDFCSTFWCEARCLFKYVGCEPRLLFNHYGWMYRCKYFVQTFRSKTFIQFFWMQSKTFF